MKVLLLLLVVLPLGTVVAQVDTTAVPPETIARAFVKAYNDQDYPKLFSMYPGTLPEIKPEEKVEMEKEITQELTKRFADVGKISIDSINRMQHRVLLRIHYQNDPYVPETLILSFNKDSMLQGFFDKDPDFLYPTSGTSTASRLSLQQAHIHAIDSVASNRFMKDKFNGNLLVVENGKTIYKKSFGFADLDKHVSLNDSSVFELASCSKQFTAMAIMILAERHQLEYSDSIQRFLPDFPYHNITIEELLTHTSGLPGYEQLLSEKWDRTKFATNRDIVEAFKTYNPKVNFAPNEKFRYSNTGYAMLSLIIEKVSGMTYREFLDKNIFKPLGMRHTRVYNTRRSISEHIDNYAYGYVYSDSLQRYVLPDSLPDYSYVIYMDPITGDGSVNSTTVDLARWDEALRKNTLVKKETLEKAYKKHILNNGTESKYGFGEFLQSEQGSERIVFHSGGWPGYHTFIMHFLDQDASVIILSNTEYDNVSKLANRIGLILTANK